MSAVSQANFMIVTLFYQRNRVNFVTGWGGFQQLLEYWKLRYTQSPFGWSKFEPISLGWEQVLVRIGLLKLFRMQRSLVHPM